MYKAIVMDLDGTLLTSDKSVLLQDREAIRRAAEKDKIIVLCSGRSVIHMQETIQALSFGRENDYYIAFNGAMTLRAKDHAVLSKKTIDPDIVRWFIRMGRAYCEIINTQIYTEGAYYIEREHEGTRLYEASGIGTAIRVKDLEEVIEKGVLNAAFMGADPAWQDRLGSELRKHGILLVPSSPYLLEYSDPSLHKGSAVEELMRYLHIPMDEVICMGDDQNDLPMIQAAGLGVAMKNAPRLVQEQADLVTERTNDEGGAAEIIERFLL